MQSRSIYFLLLVILLAIGSGVLMAKKPLSYGLDVRGGIRLTYKMDTAKMTTAQIANKEKMQSDLVRILQNRANSGLGVSEPVVQKKGDDAFVIELPGFTNIDEARSLMSSTAKVVCYWAKTVNTDKRQNRRYQKADDVPVNGVSYASFVRSADPTKQILPGTPEYAEMVATWEPILEGEDVADAVVEILGNNVARPAFKFSASGAAKLGAWTRKYMNQRENIAFVMDNRVLSIAFVKDGEVLTDTAQIDGQFPTKYVQTLTELVKAGSLPVDLVELSSEKVDPTIGSQALPMMVNAGLLSLGIVCLLLIVYYAWPGIIATFAMVLYGLFTLAFLNGFSATFSLASIAAFILSTGMAVDANILVFERLKEELRSGKELAKAMEVAFKRAATAIIDSNICTVLTCAVLWFFGTGPVKGFASTLAVGVGISYFTAFVVTRVLMQGAFAAGLGRNPKWYGMGKGWYKDSQDDSVQVTQERQPKLLNIVGRSNLFFGISALLIIPGFIFIGMGGIKTNVEFQGGYEGTYKLAQGATIESIRQGLEKGNFLGSNVKLAETKEGKMVYITVPPRGDMSVSDPAANKKIADAAGLSTEGSSFTAIGPTVQKETVTNAINGIIFASVLIMIYLGFRFGSMVGGLKNGLKFGASAVIALVHDVLFVIGTAGIVGYFLHWEISALFITAMLTVIGFSVHDTIIIFDRVRENLRKPHSGETFEHLCDHSVTQSVARSINTSMSAVIPLTVLILFGTPTPELKFMCLSMLLGISIGAYSSIFNATPILYLWNKAVMKSKGESAGLMAEAARESKLRAQMAAAAAAGATGMAPAASTAGTAPSAAGYGQVKRKSSVVEQSKQNVDDEE